MKQIKTLKLTGGELVIKISGRNCDIRNDSAGTIYVACKPNIVADADGVMSIPAGHAVKLLDVGGTLYVLGTGSAQICGNDYSELVFKSAASAFGGGGTVDDIARQAITVHEANTETHVTATDKTSWNGKAELSDIPTSLPANGGNADTLDGLHANEIASNPNQLINPNYRINQRGQTEYSATNKYTVDGWKINSGTVGVITPMDGYIHAVISPSTGNPGIVQKFEDISRFAGKTVTVSAKIRSDTPKMALRIWLSTISSGAGSRLKYHSGNEEWEIITNTVTLPEDINNMTVETDIMEAAGLNSDKYFDVEWVKLEFGSVATPFIPPDPTMELLKCQRYYQVHSTGNIDPVDLRPSMATISGINARSDGRYEYIAEL